MRVDTSIRLTVDSPVRGWKNSDSRRGPPSLTKWPFLLHSVSRRCSSCSRKLLRLPASCRAALAVLEVMQEEGFLARAEALFGGVIRCGDAHAENHVGVELQEDGSLLFGKGLQIVQDAAAEITRLVLA